jgi:hypothetical protein
MLFGCARDINEMSLEEIIDTSIKEEANLYNTNNKGYRYYLPTEFSIKKDADFVQELTSHSTTYYLNVDIVSYYYKNPIKRDRELDDYKYYSFSSENKDGYLKIRQNNDNFFVELCYNYAIIEVEVEESELRYAVSRGISILNSIEYNELVIGKYIEDNDIENRETVYNIPEPENKEDNKNVLEYIEEFEVENSDDLD